MAFYVSASSPGEIDTQLAALSEKSLLNLYKESEAPRELETRRQDAIHALRQHAGRWILLIDAADTEAARDATNKLLKELAGGRFVITSRRDDWPKATVYTLTLDLFTPEEARACLRSRYWKAEPSTQELADFDRVADELGHLPLALALAGSYMYSSRISPARYLEEWREKHDRLLAFSAPDVDYDRSLLAAFELSYSQLDAAAAALLSLLAWLAPEPFPRRLVEDSERVRDILSATAEGSEKPDTPEALAQLRMLSLIQLDEESLRLHKLVLECARAVLPEETRRKSIAAALGWIAASLPDPDFDEAGWKLWHRLTPHLNTMVETAEQFHIENEPLVLMCNHYGGWLYQQARHQAAEPLLRRALAIDEETFGPDHPKVAVPLNNLASLLLATNRLAEAEPLMRRALVILLKFTRATGHFNPHLYATFGNYMGLLTEMSLREEQVRQRLVELGKESGFDEESYRQVLRDVFK